MTLSSHSLTPSPYIFASLQPLLGRLTRDLSQDLSNVITEVRVDEHDEETSKGL